jgi:glucose/arabinose dehydrogenase
MNALPGAAQTVDDPALAIAPYAVGFTSPSFFRFLPTAAGTPIEFLVCEIGTGRVLHYRDGARIGPVADFDVASLFERGLFGMALHPDFASHPWVYLYYTASNTGTDTNVASGALDNRVVRLRWNGMLLDSLQVLATLPVGSNHNGGALVFGPDGMLYGSIGEAGSTMGRMQNIAAGTPPNDTSMIFRLQSDGTIPPGNPFAGAGLGMERAFAYGMRNVFGLDVDPVAGALWATDNGASLYDEIDRVEAGMNGGWRRIMGPASRTPGGIGNLWIAPGAAYREPIFSFKESFGITAIHFQRGTALGEHYAGDLFVAAHNSMELYHFDLTLDRSGIASAGPVLADSVADTSAERDLVRWATGVGVVTDMDTGPDGALYVLSYSGMATLYRVSRRATSDAEHAGTTAAWNVVPNPSRNRVTLVRRDGVGPHAAAELYDVSGRLVRRLLPSPAGIEWDGRDGHGRPVGAGVYWARIPGASAHSPARIVRIGAAH